MFPTMIKPGEIRKFVHANGAFHVVVGRPFPGLGESEFETKLNANKI